MNGTTSLPRVVVFNDYSNYDSAKSRNGGCYWFETRYTRVAECPDFYEVTEHTSGEFCPYCRSWNCSGDCHEAEFMREAELKDRIQWFEELYADEDDCYISFED